MSAIEDTQLARWQAEVFELDLLDVRRTGVRTGTVWPRSSTVLSGNDGIAAKRSVVLG